MSEPERLPSSDHGQETARNLLDDFDNLLYSRAEVFARQRKTTRIDDADFNAAFRDLLASEPRDWRFWVIRIFGTLLILAGGVAMTYGISTWATGLAAVLLVGIGCVSTLIGAGLQHLPFFGGGKV